MSSDVNGILTMYEQIMNIDKKQNSLTIRQKEVYIMSTSITNVNTSLSAVSFEVKNITTAETLLMSLDKMNDKSTKSVAYILRQVYDKKLLDENQNIAEWAQEKFGYKKAMVYQLIKVNTELMNGNKSIFCTDDNDFSITQLLRMVSRKANNKKHTK